MIFSITTTKNQYKKKSQKKNLQKVLFSHIKAILC